MKRTLAMMAMVFGLLSCGEGENLVDPEAIRPQQVTQQGCVEQPELCDYAFGTDPHPEDDGYWMGPNINQTKCVHATGVGINDADRDGLDDNCESALALQFRPELVYSPFDCNMGMEPYWAAKWFPGGNGHGTVVRIAYLFAYYQDCGAPPTYAIGCGALRFFGNALTLNGLAGTIQLGPLPLTDEDVCAGHKGDSEFITVDVAYDIDSKHWITASVFYSAHWETSGDHSRRAYHPRQNPAEDLISFPTKMGGYPEVWVAHGKHGNYPSRDVCEDDGGQADQCAGNYKRLRVRGGTQYNVGSLQKPFINSETCVSGGALVATNPEFYRQECFWKKQTTFAGWDKLAPGITPYITPLVVAYECWEGRVVYGMFVDCVGGWGVQR